MVTGKEREYNKQVIGSKRLGKRGGGNEMGAGGGMDWERYGKKQR